MGLTLTKSDEQNCIRFLQDLIRIPSPSGQEGAVAARVAQEMQRAGFRDVGTDRMGSVVGRVFGSGSGPTLVINGHLDTVGVGNPAAWQRDPFGGAIEGDVIFGRGAADMKGALAAMIYGAKALLEARPPLRGSLYVVAVVQEEPHEGAAMRTLIEDTGLQPSAVLLGEPTNLQLALGHRGRVEIHVKTLGRSCHASTPELGKNAIYDAARLMFGIELLSAQLLNDETLGRGSIAVTRIESQADSHNVIPDRCTVIVDRRLTLGETEARALAEIRAIIQREGVRAEMSIPDYELTSYTGHMARGREYYPAWLIPEDHPLVRQATRGIEQALGYRPRLGTWAFSTDGVYTMGTAGIPTLGFGPGEERFAHVVDEQIRLSDVLKAANGYAHIALEVLGGR